MYSAYNTLQGNKGIVYSRIIIIKNDTNLPEDDQSNFTFQHIILCAFRRDVVCLFCEGSSISKIKVTNWKLAAGYLCVKITSIKKLSTIIGLMSIL